MCVCVYVCACMCVRVRVSACECVCEPARLYRATPSQDFVRPHTVAAHTVAPCTQQIPRVSTCYSMLDKQVPKISTSLLNKEPCFSMAFCKIDLVIQGACLSLPPYVLHHSVFKPQKKVCTLLTNLRKGMALYSCRLHTVEIRT